jgi:predicted transcriptional regulator of viral defense system
MKRSSKKTLGPVSAYLITQLKKADKSIFRIRDAQRILDKDEKAAADLLSKLAKKGVVSRLKAGLFMIVPIEAGKNYLENRYVIAREIMRPNRYYISHGSAMAIHGLTTQPVLNVQISSAVRKKDIVISGIKFSFCRAKPGVYFGTEEKWVTKQEKASVSDLERTIADCLARPELCGGVSEAAKGIWLSRGKTDYIKLVRYVKKLGIKAVAKRLGFILQRLELADKKTLAELKKYSQSSETYVLLDPTLKKAGKYLREWRLRVNFNPGELNAAVWA